MKKNPLATRLPSAAYGSVKVAKGAYLKAEVACITGAIFSRLSGE